MCFNYRLDLDFLLKVQNFFVQRLIKEVHKCKSSVRWKHEDYARVVTRQKALLIVTLATRSVNSRDVAERPTAPDSIK